MDEPLFWPTVALVVATAALVVITGYYAWQTRQTVGELKRARSAALLPRLKASMKTKGVGVAFIRITNVGPGPALNVDATITLLPGGSPMVWREHAVPPGDAHDFIAYPDDAEQPLYHLDELTVRFDRLALRATYADALGGGHSVEETIEIREWWNALKASHHLVDKDFDEEQAKQLKEIAGELVKIRRGAEKIRRQGESTPWRWETPPVAVTR